jgi:glycosyltransferase involved in cell wall biosynthesis
VILSFEGPDPYAMVGGLGVRVTQLAAALGDAGINTDLVFVGAPDRSGVEMRSERVRLRRWCQWISQHRPGGVYDGENDKAADYAVSAPPMVCAEIVAPARQRGENVLVIGEDWQIAPAIVQLDADLRRRGLRESATLLWNANNTYGFWRIDWRALTAAAAITAVSKYMKFELSQVGVSSLVIPNGIPATLLGRNDASNVRALRAAFGKRRMLLKVGRFDPDKRWMQAIDAVANLREEGIDVHLIVRGGKEPYRDAVLDGARSRGLQIDEISLQHSTPSELATAISESTADVLDIRTFVTEDMLYAMYGAVDAVLANSGREPFGLVGLEVMAANGIPICGSTGEDYAQPFENAIVCDTGDPAELATYLRMLFADPKIAKRLRRAARQTAARYTWPVVLDVLEAKLAFLRNQAVSG